MKKKIFVRGPVLSRSGYGEQARFAIRALRAHEDRFDIYIYPTGWGKTGWVWEDTEERRWIDTIISKTAQYKGPFDASLQITIPNEWEEIAPINIGYTAGIETHKVAPEWIEKSMLMNRIIVVSNHAKQIFERTSYHAKNEKTGEEEKDFRCRTEIDVVNYPVRDFETDPVDLDLEYEFNFLSVAQISPRKNAINMIKWFVEEFREKEVGLVLKLNTLNDSISDRYHTKENLKNLIDDLGEKKCKIYLLHGSLKEEEMTALYKHPKIKAFINLAHGEGFGLPIFEAAYNEIPVIAPDWSGHLDFLYIPKKNKKTGKIKNQCNFAKVRSTLKPVQKDAVWDGVIQADSMWCYPEEKSYKKRLKEVLEDYTRYKNQAKRLNKWIRKNFTAEQKYLEFADSVSRAIGGVTPEEVDTMFKEVLG